MSPYGYGMGMPFFGGGGIGYFPMGGMGSLFNIIIIMFFLNIAVQTVRGMTNKDEDGNNSDKKFDKDSEDDRW